MEANWMYIVVAICIVLAAGLVWLEVRRQNKHWLPWRIAAVLIACAALGCIILPLSYQKVIKPTDKQVILLTAGFDIDSIPSNTKLFTLDAAVKAEVRKAQLITPEELAHNGQLHIYGYGLNDYELEQLGGRAIAFHPVQYPSGVTSLSYNSSPKVGEALYVQGQYHNSNKQPVKLVLKGLNTGLDSVIIPAVSTSSFTLKTIPKVIGRAVYELFADDRIQGNLPIQVQPAKSQRVLMLSASPDFETKFLKNWLSSNGFSVALRSAISKDKFNTEFINLPQFNMGRLQAATLNKFDVVIGELSVLNNLNGAESSALKQAVSDGGLGIIAKADSTGKQGWLQRSFPVDRPLGKDPAPGQLIISGEKSFGKLNTGLAHIILQNGTQPVVTNAQNAVLANSTLIGAGKVVFTTLNNTFSWMLAGNKQDYTRLWSALINAAARRNNNFAVGLSSAPLPFTGQPVKLMLQTPNASSVMVNGQNVAVMQNPYVPFEWQVLYRPLAAGWQSVLANNRLSYSYTYPKTDWQGIRALEKIGKTKDYEKKYSKLSIVTKQIHKFMRIDVPKIYFYILLLAACTFLWIETKISG